MSDAPPSPHPSAAPTAAASGHGAGDPLAPLPEAPPGRYRHYKGGEYEVRGVVRHSETLEPLVLYRIGGASQKATETCGYWYFYGDRVRYMRWDLEFYRSYRRDLDRLPPPRL